MEIKLHPNCQTISRTKGTQISQYADSLLCDIVYFFIKRYYFTVQNLKSTAPGSTMPRATTLSYPAGGVLKEQLSLVMVCSLPRATSLRNITPVFLEGRTENGQKVKSTML